MTLNISQDPHQDQPVLTAGEPLEKTKAAMVLFHGRGASAENILLLTEEFDRPGFAYLAPQASGSTWYPHSFLSPVAENEPWLSSALGAVGRVLIHIAAAGIPPERIILLGFSQGACLALEYAARNPRRYGGVAGLSGALIENGDTLSDYTGSLKGTPVFIGCSDADFHIPKERVLRSANVFRQMEADVTDRLYPGMGHTVNRDEIEFIKGMMAAPAER